MRILNAKEIQFVAPITARENFPQTELIGCRVQTVVEVIQLANECFHGKRFKLLFNFRFPNQQIFDSIVNEFQKKISAVIKFCLYKIKLQIYILEKSQYTKSSDEGACCVSAEEQHEGCYIHSSFTLVSDEVCRSACDNDFQCKGYTIQDVNGGMFCRLATAPSQCPHNWNILTGGNGPLDPSSPCETDYEGCYLKQDGKLFKVIFLN